MYHMGVNISSLNLFLHRLNILLRGRQRQTFNGNFSANNDNNLKFWTTKKRMTLNMANLYMYMYTILHCPRKSTFFILRCVAKFTFTTLEIKVHRKKY